MLYLLFFFNFLIFHTKYKGFLMKLYSRTTEREREPVIKLPEIAVEDIYSEGNGLDEDLCALDETMTAWDSADTVHSSMAAESFDFLNKGNHVLYNEYIKNLCDKVGIVPATVSLEDFSTKSDTVITRQFSMEGLIGDLWGKVKAFFKRVYEGIKAFFVRWFTRLGRVKQKLKNIKEVLEDTNKSLKNSLVEKVPGGLARRFPMEGSLSYSEIAAIVKNVISFSDALASVTDDAKFLASWQIIDPDFVEKVKTLRSEAKTARDDSASTRAQAGPVARATNGAFGSDESKAKISESNSLKDLANNKDADADYQEASIKDANRSGDLGGGIENDDDFTKAKADLDDLFKSMEDSFKPLIDKPLVDGKVLKKIEIKRDAGIEIETDSDTTDKPVDLHLTDKSSLLDIINKCLGQLENSDKVNKKYSAINDAIVKNLDAADKLFRTLDGIDKVGNSVNQADIKKYRNVIMNRIKPRLNMMKAVFTGYNKVGKNGFDMMVSVSEGVADYSTVCLKNFG